MKVAIVNVQCPFVRGGAEYLADSLAHRIVGRGHAVEQIKLPFKWYPPQAIAEHMLACKLLSLRTGDPDLVIAFKFPAYLCPFRRKRLWLFHQFRQAYELWGTPYAGMPDTPETRGIRDMIHRADSESLGGVEKLYTNSKVVANRLRNGNGIEADGVLYPPLDRPELFGPGDFGEYFFYPSRIGAAKRQLLAVEAMAHVRSPFRLVIAGKPDSVNYGQQMEALIEKLGLRDRVQMLGWVTEEQKASWMRGACGAIYIPFDEDSYGFVTLEAFHSHKPLLTFTDSGGTHELVQDGRNGLIVEPSAEALAEAMERTWNDKQKARDQGEAGFATLGEHHIEWDTILNRLLD